MSKDNLVDQSLKNYYGDRLRLRVCGLLQKNDQVLLVRHEMGSRGEIWIPPGGEVQFGESATQALEREFMEETGLKVTIGHFIFAYEFIDAPFHSVELFFQIDQWKGEVITGHDPETEAQVIQEVRFVSFDELRIMDKRKLHGIFSLGNEPEDISSFSGFLGKFPLTK